MKIIRPNNTKPKLYIKPLVNDKMKALVTNCPSEVGWHGFVERKDANTYVLYDVILYPQYVTGTSITPDEEEYAAWLDNQMEFENFHQMRFHGHSHVNMPCQPSSIDRTYRNNLTKNMKKDDFYFFMILNKSGDYTLEMYNMQDNTIYETQDIDISVSEPENKNKAESWAKKLLPINVKEKVKAWPSTISNQKTSSTRTKSNIPSISSDVERSAQLLPRDWQDWD